jgi:two-component system response regulator AtoC
MRKTVVIIDDVEAVLLCLRHSLTIAGYNVYTYRKPLECLDEVPSLNPDIVVVDYLMFDCNGIELIGMLRERGVYCPYILFTSMYDEEAVRECEKLKVKFLNKKRFVIDSIKDIIGESSC